ncbi:hypothetical protein ABPG72_021198 [Tetrahymena utriculariae]
MNLKCCKSKYLGGAISGVSQPGTKNNFFECSSQIGGALYGIQQIKNIISMKNFSNNQATLAANNCNLFPLNLNIFEILEINSMNSNDTNLFIQTNQYLYPGLIYIIRLSIEVDGENYEQYTKKNRFWQAIMESAKVTRLNIFSSAMEIIHNQNNHIGGPFILQTLRIFNIVLIILQVVKEGVDQEMNFATKVILELNA